MALDAALCLTADEGRLPDLMSEVSEDCWHAGWLSNTENEVWRLVVEGGAWGQCDSAYLANLLARIRDLSLQLDAWTVDADRDGCDNKAIDLGTWRRDYARWRQASNQPVA
jgi:hypothetical protein